MKKVRALREGYYGNQRRKPGSVFEIEDGVKVGLWMEEVGSDSKPVAKVEGAREPIAMSQVGKSKKHVEPKKLADEDVI